MCEIHQPEDVRGIKKGISQFVDQLVVAATNARIYAHDHPRVTETIDELVCDLGEHVARTGSDHLVIGSADGFLFHDRRPLVGASLSASKIIEALDELRSGGMSFGAHASQADFTALLEVLGAPRGSHADHEEANRDLTQRGSRWIRFLPPYRRRKGQQEADRHAADLEHLAGQRLDLSLPVELYQKTVAVLQDSMVRVCHGQELVIDETRSSVEAILNRLTIDATSMMSISRYERYDAYTFGHSIRVCFLALNFARTLFSDQEMLTRVGTAALLHDIGKARVPFEVLYSKNRLTPDERLEMNRHPSHGAEILLDQRDPDPFSVAAAFGHHRTLDGGGYPSTLHELRQSIGTRIVKICDVYEALTATRSYKPRMSSVRAYRIMMSMDDHFDTTLLRRFVQVNGIYPVGSSVRVSTGERARVARQTSDLQRPVLVVRAEGESDGLSEEERTRDLSLDRNPGAPWVSELLEAA